MSIDLGWLATESRAIKHATRRVDKAVAQLRDSQLARYEVAAGQQIDDGVLDALRAVVQSSPGGVVITVSQPVRAQTKEQHAQDV